MVGFDLAKPFQDSDVFFTLAMIPPRRRRGLFAFDQARCFSADVKVPLFAALTHRLCDRFLEGDRFPASDFVLKGFNLSVSGVHGSSYCPV